MAFVILVYRVHFGKSEGGDLSAYVRSNEVNFDTVYGIVRYFRIRPILYRVLSAHPTDIPARFLATLRKDVFTLAAGNMERMKEVRDLCGYFGKHGVILIPYKGAVLSRRLFGDYVSRETVDIDFLINEKDFSKVRTLFLDAGYQTDYYYDKDFESYLLKYDSEYQFHKTTATGGSVKVEVHWNVIHKMQDTPVHNMDLFRSLYTAAISDSEIDILDDEHAFLVMLVHHGVNDMWRSLKHLIDTAAFMEKYEQAADWEKLRQNVVSGKIYHTAAVGFALCHALFGSRVPSGFACSPDLVSDILNEVLTFPPPDTHKLKWQNFKRQLSLRDNLADKWNLVGYYLLTGLTPNMRDVEAMRIPKKMAFLYPIFKPFRMLVNVIRR